MINNSLIRPKSIVVVGGSNNLSKPGGKILNNIITGNYSGDLSVVNPKESIVQGLKCYESVLELPNIECAIIAIPAIKCLDVIRVLLEQKRTKAFIILSAGFSEAGIAGKKIEDVITEIINKHNACLIGPNCIGFLNENYNGIFTTPIPVKAKNGCDLISSSGATAVFLMEAGIPLGLKFNNVFSVGNAAQISAEDVLEYMDLNYDEQTDSKIKLLYIETIKDISKLIKHAKSLIKKGVRIAAIKSGKSEDGSRAAQSHTGALSSSDVFVRAIFKKAGIVYCSSREELLSVASIFYYKKLTGKNIAVITHAGGSAVMLTDTLNEGGLQVPEINDENSNKLLCYLHPGSSVSNPIDFLATGTAEQLGIIIDYCEHKFDHIDAMVVVFGSPGLFDVANVYDVLSVKLEICKKPIFPVLPSIINANKEINDFIAKGHINFPDEVVLGRALSAVYNTKKPFESFKIDFEMDVVKIRKIIESNENGFLSNSAVKEIMDAATIPSIQEIYVSAEEELEEALLSIQFPIVMKVVGPLHKTELGGVILNVLNIDDAKHYFLELMKIENAEAVLIQPMLTGLELFVGVQKEGDSNHVILCGLGGIYIEILNDFSSCLFPVCVKEAENMIKELKGFKLIKGYRGQEGVNFDLFVDIILKLSALVEIAPEINELDINPLIAFDDHIIGVDCRIKLEK